MARPKPRDEFRLGQAQNPLERVLTTVASATTSDRPRDLLPMMERYASSLGGQIMPPSPGVHGYAGAATYDPIRNVVSVTVKVTRAPEARRLADLPPATRSTRSRLAPGLSARPLIQNALRKRETKVLAGRAAAQKLALSPDLSRQVAAHVLGALERHSEVNLDVIERYIRDHWTSGVMPGIKTSSLAGHSRDEWQAVLDAYLAFQARCYKWHPDLDGSEYPASDVYPGMRARPAGYEDVTKVTGVPWRDEEWEERYEVASCRPIQFGPPISIGNMFLPDKGAFADDVYTGAAELMGLDRSRWLFPIVEGGACYGRIEQARAEGLKLTGGDGVGHEGHVPTLLGPGFRGQSYRFGTYECLPSGLALTSVLGTLGLMAEARHIAQGYDVALGQGDDLTLAGKSPRLQQVENVFETDAEDEAAHFVLGLAFDSDHPHYVGAKETIDSSDAGRPARFDSSARSWFEEVGRKVDAETTSWVDGYFGLVGGRRLIDVVSGMQGGVLGREAIEAYVSSRT